MQMATTHNAGEEGAIAYCPFIADDVTPDPLFNHVMQKALAQGHVQ